MIPADLSYTTQHEWVKIADGSITVGVTDHAQDALGDIVDVELPAVGRQFAKDEEAVVVESTKAAASVYAPVGGTVTEVNAALADDPGAVNLECYGGGWMFKLAVADEGELASLMDAAAYEKFLSQQD